MLNMVRQQLKMLFNHKVLIVNFYGYPIILTLIIGYLTKNFYGNGISSYEYYSTSMLIFIFMGAGLITVYNFIDTGVLNSNFRSIYAPISKSAIYVSQVISTTIFSFVGITLNVLIFRFILKITYNNSELFIILVLTTLAFLSSTIAILLCSFTSNIGSINGIFNLIQAFFCFIGGAFFSMEALGGIPAMLSKLSPVKYIIDGIFLSIYDNSDLMLLSISFTNIVIALIVLVIVKKKFIVESYI